MKCLKTENSMVVLLMILAFGWFVVFRNIILHIKTKHKKLIVACKNINNY